MKYIIEFRDQKLIKNIAAAIRRELAPDEKYSFMEVCGGHTTVIARFGLRSLLPSNIRLVSGPGCPVCVTPNSFLDMAIALCRRPGVTVATFGDMFRVPSSSSSLEKERAAGADVRIVYSPLDALGIARKTPSREVVFLGVGFETTAPTVAQSVIIAKREKIGNYSVLSAHKTMPAALEALINDRNVAIDGFIMPGHVSAIIGPRPYEFLATRYGKGSVISGFEPLDIMQSILMLTRQERPAVETQYTRVIGPRGNALAKRAIAAVFEPCDAVWRGIGVVKGSGLRIRNYFSAFDAGRRFRLKVPTSKEPRGCRCGEVLKGLTTPPECGLFGKGCTPAHAVGACMVSSEGACGAWFRYGEAGSGWRPGRRRVTGRAR